MSSKRFSGKIVIITGASSGIGRATAVAFGKEEATVVVAARRREQSLETVRLVVAAGGRAQFVETDVTKADDVERMVAATVAAYGRVDIAFNNAGGAESPMPFVEQPEAAFDQVMDVAVKGTWLCMKAVIAAMLKTGGGAIVNMSSIAGVVGVPGVPIYTASKHAVLGLTKATALEHARAGIRINAICPGAVETEGLAGYFNLQPAVKEAMLSAHPVGRLGTPEEVAAAVLWLSSAESSFMTGQALMLDGGHTIR